MNIRINILKSTRRKKMNETYQKKRITTPEKQRNNKKTEINKYRENNCER